MSEKNKKKLDIILLILFPVLGVTLSLLLNFNFLLTTTLFLILPSIYLSIRNKDVIVRNLIFVLPFSIVTGIIGGYMLVLDGLWLVPTIFPFRILGEVTIEELIWYISAIYFCIIVYEHFQDRKRHNLTEGHIKTLFIILFLLALTFIALLITDPLLLQISYVYFLAEVILIVTAVFILLKYPNLLSHLFKVSLYLIPVSFMNLFVGAKVGNWIYKEGNFIGWTSIFNVAIPYEEIILALILWVVIIEYFEFFNDRKDLDKM